MQRAMVKNNIFEGIDQMQADRVFNKLSEENCKFNEDLEKRAKKKEELIVQVPLTIDEIIGEHQIVTYTPEPLMIGGKNPSYTMGVTQTMKIYVEENESPIRVITYNLILPLESGDSIIAYILKGKEEYFKDCIGQKNGFKMPVYTDRDLQKQEHALRIDKMRGKKRLASYRSPDCISK